MLTTRVKRASFLLAILVIPVWLSYPIFADTQAPSAAQTPGDSENPFVLIKNFKGTPIDFNLEICAFKLYDAPGAEIDVYYEIPNRQLAFKPLVSDEFATSLVVAVRILDKDGKILKETASRGSTRVKTEKETKDPALSGNFISSFNLEPGDYVFKVGVCDNVSGAVGVKERKFSVKSLPEGELGISSVLFSSDVRKAESEDDPARVKGDWVVTSNPTRTYRIGDTLSVYFNIYNLKLDNAGKPRFKVSYVFKREGQRRMWRDVVKGERKKGENQGHLYSNDLLAKFKGTDKDKFKPGKYTLFIKVTDELGNKAVEAKEAFTILE